MKKILILLFSLFILSSCHTQRSVIVYDDPSTALFNEIDQFNYNNHKYIWFKYKNKSWIVHDPDCECLYIDYD